MGIWLHSHECGSSGREKVRRVQDVGLSLTLWENRNRNTMNPDQRVQAGWEGVGCDRASGPP
jgi:hypothetical protein